MVAMACNVNLAQIDVAFQNMVFLVKFVSATFNHYLHGHAKFWEQKILQ